MIHVFCFSSNAKQIHSWDCTWISVIPMIYAFCFSLNANKDVWDTNTFLRYNYIHWYTFIFSDTNIFTGTRFHLNDLVDPPPWYKYFAWAYTPKKKLTVFEVRLNFWDTIIKYFEIRLRFWNTITPVAGSIFRPLSQTHISKRKFKNGHNSRFCFVFQKIQVISSAKFFSAVQLRNEGTPPDFKAFFVEKRPWKRFSTNVQIRGEMNPLHRHKVMSVGYQVKQNLKSRSWKIV